VKADYIMVGGFLGAGKTTAMLRLAEHLTNGGRRVGLITNDQSYGLVDTVMLGSHGFPVQEITGGCFCCRFNSLTEAADRLTQQARPEVFLAEPVGSCTDLRASVQYPLSRLYGDNYRIAPLSVLVDPIRALRILGLEPGKPFSPKVLYIYGKQLEEADIIVINKSDLLDPARRARLEQAMHDAYPRAEIITMSARSGEGFENWADRVASAETGTQAPPDVDYEIYAEGEALLGWFNSTLLLSADAAFDGNDLLLRLALDIRRRLSAEQFEIAHLKMTLTPDEEAGDLGVINLVRTGGQPELSHTLRESLSAGELIINLRAEGSPEILRESARIAVETVAKSAGLRVETRHEEYFRPAKPVPTYRMVAI
jgi:Ni2+-binding GTPase involved in maturation of urease and hydrogenase